jgi:hypothetical protein
MLKLMLPLRGIAQPEGDKYAHGKNTRMTSRRVEIDMEETDVDNEEPAVY